MDDRKTMALKGYTFSVFWSDEDDAWIAQSYKQDGNTREQNGIGETPQGAITQCLFAIRLALGGIE